MSATWRGPEQPAWPPLGVLDWLRFALRGLLWALGTLVLLLLYFLAKLLDRIAGTNTRSPIVSAWARMGAWLAGIRVLREGKPMRHPGAIVANHGSWLDIFVVRAAAPIYFVSKAEVRNWPVIGWLATTTDTLFIERKRSAAGEHAAALLDRLGRGQKLCFFPEGTSSDGLRVLPFKSTLFSVFMSDDVKESMWVQPVTVIYRAPKGEPENFYGWWGDMPFAGHVLQVFGRSTGGAATVVFHDPVRAADFADRKTLCRYSDEMVRSAMEREMAARGIIPPPEQES